MLKELRRFGDNSGLSGQMTIQTKRSLKNTLFLVLVYCISLIVSILKASLEEIQRNKFLGDFSQFQAFISNTRDNWFQDRVSFPPTIKKDFFLPPPTHSPFRSLILLGNPSCHLKGSQAKVHCRCREAIHVFESSRSLRHPLKWAQAVKVRGLGATQHVKGGWRNFPRRSHTYCQKGEKRFHFRDRLFLWSLIWHPLLSNPMYRQERGNLQIVL